MTIRIVFMTVMSTLSLLAMKPTVKVNIVSHDPCIVDNASASVPSVSRTRSA